MSAYTGEKKTTILLVDDEPLIREYLRFTVEQWGFTVVGESSSGEDAVSAAECRRPALILMDINLGGNISGLEAASAILGRHPVPVIFMSAYREKDLKPLPDHECFTGFITKPIEESELRAMIGKALSMHEPIT